VPVALASGALLSERGKFVRRLFIIVVICLFLTTGLNAVGVERLTVNRCRYAAQNRVSPQKRALVSSHVD
jgi:hypothetical protein